jgi:hypothetical protein
MVALMNNPSNARVFERADGLLAASALLREPETTSAVKKTVLELLYFYLLPEEQVPTPYSTGTTKRIRSSGSSNKSTIGSKGSGDTSLAELDERSLVRTVRDKQKMLGKYLNNVAGLQQEFRSMDIFEGAVG